MISLSTSSWLNLTVTVLESHGYTDLDDVRQILWEHYQARAQFASPRGKPFRYILEFDNPKLEVLFKLKYSEYLNAD